MRPPGPTYYGPGGPGYLVRHGFPGRVYARRQEAESAEAFAEECAHADPEDFDPIKGRFPSSIGRYPSVDRSKVVINSAARPRGVLEIPEFAVVRVGKTTAHVVHTPSGKIITDEMSIPDACVEQERITEVMAQFGAVA